LGSSRHDRNKRFDWWVIDLSLIFRDVPPSRLLGLDRHNRNKSYDRWVTDLFFIFQDTSKSLLELSHHDRNKHSDQWVTALSLILHNVPPSHLLGSARRDRKKCFDRWVTDLSLIFHDVPTNRLVRLPHRNLNKHFDRWVVFVHASLNRTGNSWRSKPLTSFSNTKGGKTNCSFLGKCPSFQLSHVHLLGFAAHCAFNGQEGATYAMHPFYCCAISTRL
jgi:hypothetical protein